MSQTITNSSKELVKSALDAVDAIGREQALSFIDSTDRAFVDLRDGTKKAKTEAIPGAIRSSRAMLKFYLDPEVPARKAEFNQDKTHIFYCAIGGRSGRNCCDRYGIQPSS